MPTITKTQVESYKIRNDKVWQYADITIDEGEKSGRIQIASDYGDWQYYWGSCGKSFKPFLISLDIHYIAGKFGADRWFDLEKTLEQFRESIKLEGNPEDAEVLLMEINQLSDYTDKEVFCSEFRNRAYLMDFFEYHPEIVTGIDPSFMNFWNNIWPVFITELRTELSPK